MGGQRQGAAAPASRTGAARTAAAPASRTGAARTAAAPASRTGAARTAATPASRTGAQAQRTAPPAQVLLGSGLGDVENIRQFNKYKASFLQRIVERADTLSPLTDAQRKSPEAEEESSEDKAKAADEWISKIVDPAGNGLDTTGSYFSSKAGGSQDNSYSTGNSIFKCVKTVYRIGLLIKELVDYAGINKKTSSGERLTTGSEKWGMAKDFLDVIAQAADSITSTISAFSKLLEHLPIVGVLVGCAAAALGFVGDMVDLMHASESIRRMKEQRKAAKAAILDKQAPNSVPRASAFTEEREQVSTFRRTRTKVNKIRKEYDPVEDAGTHKSRAKRLDERIAEVKASGVPENQKGLVRDLEDYDVTRELASTNEKREVEGLVSLIFNDITGFATSMASLDPSGMGSTVGTGVSAAVAGGALIRKAVAALRQVARNNGAKGANMNKSTKNKSQRRHNLAVIMYDRIRELSAFGYKNLPVLNVGDTVDSSVSQKAFSGLPSYQTVDERVAAMGVTGALVRASSAKEMVDTMRKGFYREND
jgi:hypothetical protein